MPRFAISYNDRSSLYEVHVEGCKHHEIVTYLEVVTTVEAETAADAAADFEGRNDGVVTKLGACVPRKSRAYYRMAHEAHQRGDHRLGNHWADRGRECERAERKRAER
jgi:hypothetical protein